MSRRREVPEIRPERVHDALCRARTKHKGLEDCICDYLDSARIEERWRLENAVAEILDRTALVGRS